jgi:hypothetical protein
LGRGDTNHTNDTNRVIASEARQSIVPTGGQPLVCGRDGSPRCARDDEVLAIISH